MNTSYPALKVLTDIASEHAAHRQPISPTNTAWSYYWIRIPLLNYVKMSYKYIKNNNYLKTTLSNYELKHRCLLSSNFP